VQFFFSQSTEITDIENNVEVNVKDMKKFFEVATSPISGTSPPQSWKSMPNLAKDMSTQTNVSYESSDDENDTENDENDKNDEDSDGFSDDDLVQPMTSLSEKLLVPIEERKKAFTVQGKF
jgi:hypothetical protein